MTRPGEDAAIAEQFGDHAESYCHRCLGPNVSWAAPSPLWNAVMRRGPGLLWNEIICPTCFAVLAEDAGVALDWRMDAQTVLADLPTVSPDGRTWDAEAWLWRSVSGRAEPIRRHGFPRIIGALRADEGGSSS